jgi:hypothetical protein
VKKLFPILFTLLSVIIANKADAQAPQGSFCFNPIPDTAKTECLPKTYNLNDSVKWFAFTTDSVSNSILVSAPTNPAFVGALQATLYSGNCNSLTLVAQHTAANNQTPILLDSLNLTPGTLYLLKISATSSLENNFSEFELCIQKTPTPQGEIYEYGLMVNGIIVSPIVKADALDPNYPCQRPNDVHVYNPRFITVTTCDTLCIAYQFVLANGPPVPFGQLLCPGAANGPQIRTDTMYTSAPQAMNPGIFIHCVYYNTPGVYDLILVHYTIHPDGWCLPFDGLPDTVAENASYYKVTVLANPNLGIGITPLFQNPACSVNDFVVKITGILNAVNYVEVHDVNYFINTFDNVLPVIPPDSILHIADPLFPCRTIGPDTLFVTFKGLCNLDTTFKIPFTILPSLPDFAISDTVCIGNLVSLTNLTTCDSNVVSWLWNFGDGTTDNIQNPPPHFYQNPGNYGITLTITDCRGITIGIAKQVTILPLPPAPVITSNKDNTCSGLATFYLPPGYISYYWTTFIPALIVGSNTNDSVTVNFNGAATNYIACAVTDSNGCQVIATYYTPTCCSFTTAPMAINLTNGGNASQLFVGAGFSTFTQGGITYTDVAGYNISVNGTLFIDINVAFRDCEILMGNKARIELTANKALYLSQGGPNGNRPTYIHACDYMWDGIYAEKPNNFIVSDKYTTIEDAENAMVIRNNNPFDIAGTIFNKNHIGILVNNYTSVPSPMIIASNNFISKADVKLQTYEPTPGSPTLRPPRTNEIGEAGVEAIFVKNITVGSQQVNASNYFSTLIRGINAVNTNLVALNDTFYNITNNYAQQNTLTSAAIRAFGLFQNHKSIVKQNTFTYCTNGVYFENQMSGNINKNDFDSIFQKAIYIGYSGGSDTNNINKNKIKHTNTGIHCYFNVYPNNPVITSIFNNTITPEWPFTSKAIWIQELAPQSGNGRYFVQQNTIKKAAIGIQAENLYNATIELNNVSIEPLIFTPIARGISIFGCNGARIYNNSVKGFPATQNLNVGGIYASISPQSTIQCNDTKDMGYGIRCEGTMPSAIYNNKMKDEYYGFWLSNNGFVGRQDDLNINNAPNNNPSYNRWQGTFGSGFRTFASGATNGGASSFVYRNQLFYNPNPNGFIAADFSLAFNHIITNQGNNQGPLCQGVLAPQGAALKHAKLIAQDSIPFTGNISNAKRLNSQGLYTNLLLDTVNINNNNVLQNFVVTYSAQNGGKIYNAYHELCNNNLLQAQAFSNQINAACAIDSNHQYVLNTCISNQQNGNLLSQNQITNLRIIANKCPFTDGIAVYQARALLALVDSLGTIYYNNCETEIPEDEGQPTEGGNGKRAKPQSNYQTTFIDEDIQLSVFPNPANDELYIQFNDAEFYDLTFELYSLLGEKVADYKLSSGDDIELISLQQVASGVYYYVIKSNKHLIKKDKLVIIK